MAVGGAQSRALLELCQRSTPANAGVFYPHAFTRPFRQEVHGPLWEVLDKPKEYPKVIVLAPRGMGKTTIMHLANMSKRLMFLQSQCIPVICATEKQSLRRSKFLRKELILNPKVGKALRALYPGRIHGRFVIGDAAEEWQTAMNSLMLYQGAGQQIRGLVHEIWRPDFILLDDIVKPEERLNPRLMDNLLTWVLTDICQLVAQEADAESQIVLIGTILSELDPLFNLSEQAQKDMRKGRKDGWTLVHIDVFDDDLNSFYPEYKTTEQARIQYEDFKGQHREAEWLREFRNRIGGGKDSHFKGEWFIPYDETEEKLDERGIENIILSDPAKTVERHSAESAIIVLGVDVEAKRVYVRDVVHGRFHFDEYLDRLFEAAQQYNVRTVGVDTGGSKEHLTYPIENEMPQRGYYFELIELPSITEKDMRIRSLIPFYKRLQVRHNPAVCHALEQQLLAFPSGLKDVADCLAYFVPMFEKGGRYFIDDEPLPPQQYEIEDHTRDKWEEPEEDSFSDDEVGELVAGMTLVN